ncbi:MAG: hypothetical protein E7214_10865 [Clostridium sp.]|nr:hypothetical protein [Clostridium sp.]
MGYNIIDIIDKTVEIDERILSLIEDVEQKNNMKIFVMSKVVEKQMNNKIDGNKKIKKDAIEKNLEDIDFFVYDKISFLINEFNKKENELDITDIESYVKSIISIEKEEHALFLDVKGRLVNSEFGYNKENYNFIVKIIEIIERFILNLESILR